MAVPILLFAGANSITSSHSCTASLYTIVLHICLRNVHNAVCHKCLAVIRQIELVGSWRKLISVPKYRSSSDMHKQRPEHSVKSMQLPVDWLIDVTAFTFGVLKR